MRKILLTSVGVAALAVSANATDFTLSGTAKVKVLDDGNTSVDVSTAIGVSKTFDNGMVLSLSNNNMANAGYVFPSSSGHDNVGQTNYISGPNSVATTTWKTTGLITLVANYTNVTRNVDIADFGVTVNGDLA